jgi:hypothetical protein
MSKFKLEDSDIVEITKGKYVDYDGNAATIEQISKHHDLRARNEVIIDKLRKARNDKVAKDKVYFELKYRGSIEGFFGIVGMDGDISWERYANWNEGDLIYQLSTVLFDAFHGVNRVGVVLEIKRLFPDIYFEILEGFCLGNHDT